MNLLIKLLKIIGIILKAFLKSILHIIEAFTSPLVNENNDKSKTYIDENGYRRFTKSKIAVHRWVAEKKIGRKLKPDEVVHHKNRKKLDNSPGNLQVFPSQAAHQEQHDKDEEKYGFAFSYMGKRKSK